MTDQEIIDALAPQILRELGSEEINLRVSVWTANEEDGCVRLRGKLPNGAILLLGPYPLPAGLRGKAIAAEPDAVHEKRIDQATSEQIDCLMSDMAVATNKLLSFVKDATFPSESDRLINEADTLIVDLLFDLDEDDVLSQEIRAGDVAKAARQFLNRPGRV